MEIIYERKLKNNCNHQGENVLEIFNAFFYTITLWIFFKNKLSLKKNQ